MIYKPALRYTALKDCGIKMQEIERTPASARSTASSACVVDFEENVTRFDASVLRHHTAAKTLTHLLLKTTVTSKQHLLGVTLSLWNPRMCVIASFLALTYDADNQEVHRV